jgi:hypothetical protein
MPVFDVFLVLFPAEKYFLAADDGRKIHQPTRKVLELNPSLLKFSEHLLHPGKRANPIVYRLAPDIVSSFGQTAKALLIALDVLAMTIQIRQPQPKLWQKFPRLFTRVMTVETMGHKKDIRGERTGHRRERLKSHETGRLLLPGALLVTVQAQLLAPFVFIDLCLTAFFK